MNAIEVYNTINKFLEDLKNTYGVNIEYIEVYDGKITVHFKREFVEEKIAEMLLSDLIQAISKTIWGDNK